MIAIAPRWAFNAQAIDAAGDPHLQPGIHLRLIPSELLGLPAFPFIVYRLNLGPFGKLARPRTDIRWVDSRGNRLSPPFDVFPNNPVTGWLPPPENGICCWIQVWTTPVEDDGPVFPVPLPPIIRPPQPPRPPVRPPRRSQPAATDVSLQPLRAQPLEGRMPFRPRTVLRVDAVVGTARGPATVASAVRPPYQLGASRIERVVLHGRGRVTGALWIDARRLQGLDQPWRILALPIPGGARYNGIADAETQALDRVARGAPLRFGLHDVPTAAVPAAAPLATPADELARVEDQTPALLEWVKRLVDDTSDVPWNLTAPFAVSDEHGRHVGTLHQRLLGAVLQAALDPGIGRWLGFVERDEAPPSTNAGDVIAYATVGIWSLDRKRLGRLLPTLPKDSILSARTVRPLLGAVPGFRHVPRSLQTPFVGLWTVACATVGHPPARPAPPQPQDLEYGPWLPATPPDARREIIIPVTGLLPGSVVALARRKGAGITGLNPRTPSGRARPLLPAVPNESTTAGSGEFADRQAPPEAVSYRLAQTDWFGRWSNWVETPANAGTRPRPPRPVVTAHYIMPAVPDPVPDGAVSGTIETRVPVPSPEALAPGSRLLGQLEVQIDTATHVRSLSTPSSPPDELVVTVPGPPVDRAAERSVTVRARWVDSAGAVSDYSDPVTLRLVDPRPPTSVVLPADLQYAARPDVTGQSRVRLTWTASPAQKHFRVFYADETRLRAYLQKVVDEDLPGRPRAQAMLAALEAASSPVDRATVFVSNRDFWDRGLFEQLTGRPVTNTGSGPATPMHFEHALSGSLRVLSFYRLVALSRAQVEEPFPHSPMVAVAVPNTGPPPQPLLEVEPLIDLTAPVPFRARLRVRIPRGLVPAVEYRLRRSLTETRNILQMPVVNTGMVPLPGNGEAQEVTMEDTGASQLDPAGTLRPWTSYHWRVEVRSAPEPGGGPEGQWSPPSAPVSALMAVPDPPAAATAVTATRTAAGVEIRWQHPEPLIGGTVGNYSLDLYRRLPDGPERLIASIPADAPISAGGRNPDGTGEFHFEDIPGSGEPPIPAGTTYRVIVMDPIGRTSPPSAPVTV